MGELKEGEKCHIYTLEAVSKSGFCTLQELTNHLGISRHRVERIMKRVGIVLGPFMRNDAIRKKQYKRVKRPLTKEEAEAIIKAYARDVGREVEEMG